MMIPPPPPRNRGELFEQIELLEKEQAWLSKLRIFVLVAAALTLVFFAVVVIWKDYGG